MCGICGYFGKGDQEILKKMTEQLHHRGPDDEDFYINQNIGLGHKRLSIIDTSSAGKQPISNEKKNIFVVCNGEIYNYQNLKSELSHKHRFVSHCDTEIIVYLYEEIGPKVFSKLNGMFAIAIYDKKKNKIILARDRIGKKPLYWGIFSHSLIFASELKALIQHPFFKKELDLKSLNKYLIYEYVPTPHSIFKNVYKLEPGHYLEWDGQKINKECFWEIKFPTPKNEPKNKILDNLDNLINESVKTRLVSDVPLGIFLSGGLDSSTIAYYAQKNNLQKIKTFSIGFKEKSFDESKYARQVADFLGTEHYEKILNAQDSLDLIPQIANLLDEPLADSSIIPTFLLSKFTREHVTVALGGDGGDELFCGYDTFQAHKFANIYEKIPIFLRRNFIEKIAMNLPVSFNNLSSDFKIKKFITGFYSQREYCNQKWLGAFDRNQRSKLFTSEVWHELQKENEFEDIDNYLNNFDNNNFYNQLIFLYLKTYLLDDILVKVDRASMFNSLEVRAPLLDYNVIEYVNNLPINLKLKGFTRKHILKKLMENKLPRDIVYRKKKGFGIPLSYWFLDVLKPFVLETLNENKIKRQGLFNCQYINKVLQDHFSRQKDNRKLIWTLLVFEMWQDKWYK